MNSGWTGKVMEFLTYATQIVVLNFLWIMGTLAGGVILGIAPATRALGRLTTALFLGEPSTSLWRDFWSTWRTRFWVTNKYAWPFTVLFLLAGADLYAFRVAALNGWSGTGLLLAPFLIVTAACVVAYAYLHASFLRFDDSVVATIRFAFASPLAFLPTTAAILLVNLAFVMLTWQVPLVVVLIGFSVPIGFSVVLAGHALDRAYGGGFLEGDALLAQAHESWTKRSAERAAYADRMRNLK
jgi:uncharacterized membrane protein YesL